MADWYQKTVLVRLLPLSLTQLTSQRFWDNMERVTAEQITAIEQDLAATAVFHFGLDLRCLLFDATNFFTFLDSFNSRAQLPQRGHSKEGRDIFACSVWPFWLPPMARCHCSTTPTRAISMIP